MQRIDGFKIQANGYHSWNYVYYMNPPPIRVISFKGGGSRVYVYHKFVELADEQGLLDQVEEFGGSSSGAITSALAAMHFEDPRDRTIMLHEISSVDKRDIYGDTKPWQAYRIISAPLYIVSKPLEWTGKGINWCADQCNKISIGKLIGYPLKLVAGLFRALGAVSSPRTLAGLANLLVRGGVYRGDKAQASFRDHIRVATRDGIDAILKKVPANEEKKRIVTHLIEIGLLQRRSNKLHVVDDVTFSHLHELTLLPGSKFKDYYATAMRESDGEFVVFNKDNTPDMPLHYAMRYAVTFPKFYQARSYQGEKYLDGGIVDNAPVRHATMKKLSAEQEAAGVTDRMARLNVRVEYPHELHHHLWRPQPAKSKFGKLMQRVTIKLAKRVMTAGVDFFANDDEVTRAMQDEYAQRTLQLPDFDIPQMAKGVDNATRARIDAEMPHLLQAYLDNHRGEKAVIENYPELKYMPLALRQKLLATLQDPEIKSEEIFDMPGCSASDLDRIRRREIARVQRTIGVFDGPRTSTTQIYHALDVGIPQADATADFSLCVTPPSPVQARQWFGRQNSFTEETAEAVLELPQLNW